MGNNLLLACGIVTAMLATLAGLGKAIQWAVGGLRKLFRLADDLIGEPPTRTHPEGRPGFLDRLTSIEDTSASTLVALTELHQRLSAVEAQMKPNGGGSLRDAVDRMATTEPVAAP
jgi:hypothetical protein